jgi:hypothetical protein
VIGLVAYGSSLLTPSLFGDDWWYVIKGCVDNTLQCPMWGQTRPLMFCWSQLICKLFGPSVVAGHAVSIVVSILLGVLVYALLVRLLPQDHLFNLMAAAIFLVHPAVFVRTWITASNLQMGLGLFLASLLLLAHFWRAGGWWACLASLMLLVVSFGVYESQAGLAVAASVALFTVGTSRSLARRLALLTPAMLAFVFVIWRMWGQGSVGIERGYSAELLSLSPSLLLSRLLLGYRIVLQWSWTSAFYHLFGTVDSLVPAGLGTLAFLLAGVVVIVALAAALVHGSRGSSMRQADDKAQTGDPARIRRFAAVGLGGLVGIGFGYLPAMAHSPPGQGFASSRHNVLPGMGAAFLLSAVLACVSVTVGSRWRRTSLVFVLLALPFLGVGTAMQIQQRVDTAQSWREQIAVWNQLFESAPNLADGTGVYVVMPAHPYPWAPRPFEDGYWGLGTSAALSMFYANDSLHGYFIYDDLPMPEFVAEGIMRPWGVVPYDRMLMFRYERDTGRLAQLEQVPTDLLSSVHPTAELDPDLVLRVPVAGSSLRSMVSPEAGWSCSIKD